MALVQRTFRFQIIPADPGEDVHTGSARLPEIPNPAEVRKVVSEFIAHGIQRVSVVLDGRTADMFVEDANQPGEHPLNERATLIYNRQYLLDHADVDIDRLPRIYGPALVFDDPVWFV